MLKLGAGPHQNDLQSIIYENERTHSEYFWPKSPFVTLKSTTKINEKVEIVDR